MDHPTGTTLVELLLAFCLLGILAGLAEPAIARGLDRFAVRAAGDELAAAVARTQSSAVDLGGTALVMDPGSGSFWILSAAGDTVLRPVSLAARHGVHTVVSGTAHPFELVYDALGIGRMTSRTIRLVRGAAVANVSISAYGRVRTW